MSGGNRQLTILFAEGEVLVRNIIRTFLQVNFDVLVAASGYEALELSRGYAGAIDILLSDVETAGLDGMPLHRFVEAERPGIRILLIADDSSGSTRSGQPLPFLSKPFQLETLHARLKELSEKDTGTHKNAKVIPGVDGDPVRREGELAESISLSTPN